MSRIYTTEDTNKMSFEEFGETINSLLNKILDANLKLDAIAPILRSGAITGMMLAIKLKIFKVIPLGLKSNYNTGEIDQLFDIPVIEIGENSNILVCENNTYSGHTAK